MRNFKLTATQNENKRLSVLPGDRHPAWETTRRRAGRFTAGRNQTLPHLGRGKNAGLCEVFTGYDYSSPNKVYNRTEPWRYLFKNLTGINYYLFCGIGADGNAGYFNPDMTLSPSGQWFGEAMREIRSGPGALLFNKRRIYDSVGIYFSQNSIRAATALNTRIIERACAHRENILKDFEMLGLAPELVSNYEAENNPETLRKYALVFAPFCASLSANELKTFEQYVNAGGVLVLDPFFGLYDENGRLAESRSLWLKAGDESLLKAFDKSDEQRGELGLNNGKEPEKINLIAFSGASRRLTEGKPCPEWSGANNTFVVEHAPAGKGMVYNISFLIPESETMAHWLRSLAEKHGVTAPLWVEDEQGKLVADIQLARLQGEEKEFIGLVHSTWTAPCKKKEALIRWKEKLHTYDVRAGKYLGELDALPCTLDPMEPMLLCRTKHQVGEINVRLETETVRQGEILRAQIKVSGSEQSPVLCRATLQDPDKKILEPFQSKVWIKGEGLVEFPVASNDKPGAWTLEVREIISGRMVSKAVQIKNREGSKP